MQEIFKDIKGFEGFYQISNKGHVKSLKRYRFNHQGNQEVKEKILKPYLCNGYYKVRLQKDGNIKRYFIHRLVANEFLNLREYNRAFQVDHIDNNRLNNNVNNLQIITQAENIKKQMLNMLNNSNKYKDNKITAIIKSYEGANNG